MGMRLCEEDAVYKTVAGEGWLLRSSKMFCKHCKERSTHMLWIDKNVS